MAVNRTNQVAMTIALSLFVMLTFALGVSTYMFFTQREEAALAEQAARAEATEAKRRQQEIQAEMQTLRGIIGVEEDRPVAEIETGLNDLFSGDFDGFKGDKKDYLTLIEWLRGEFRERSTRVKTIEEEKKKLATETEAKVKAVQDDLDKARQAETEAKRLLAEAEKDFAGKWKGHEDNQRKLQDEVSREAERARELKNLQDLILGIADYLPPDRQERVKAAKPAEQLEIIRNELRSRAKDLARLEDVLTQVRVANPAAQEAIANQRAKDDRVEGMDGSVVDVNPRSETVIVSCKSTAGIRPGLVLHVFPPGEARPQFGDRKAVIEVTDVEGPSLLRARIKTQNERDPILAGDGVASSLLKAGTAPAIVIVGYADLDGDGRSDQTRLAELVTKAGGRVTEKVSAETALVVDLGQPKEGDRVPGWEAERKRRDTATREVKFFGTRIGNVDSLLSLLGLEADAFEGGKLPRGRSGDRFPPRR